MIVAVAGHIDHGKTALVQALTGVETDRLPEERRRGVTIEAGFAHWPIDGTATGSVVSFVDVPGHERYVRNMVAGIQGARAALLVVACDDGVMPQTREHLAILRLLGVAQWIVALTKCDQADDAAIERRIADIRRWLADERVTAKVIPVSAHRGTGLDALASAICEMYERDRAAASEVDEQPPEQAVRLFVDRVFIASGDGLVVTGTLDSGRIATGDMVQIAPAGLAARVRGLRLAGRSVQEAHAGTRCAINLAGAGINRDSVARGSWIIDPSIDRPVSRVDGWIDWLAGAAPASDRTALAVHVHVGTARLDGRISVWRSADAACADDRPLARVQLATPVSAAIGDRWIVRSTDGARTMGVITVAWPHIDDGGLRGRAHRDMLRGLDGDTVHAWTASALDACPLGLDPELLAAAWRLHRRAVPMMLERAGASILRSRGQARVVAARRLAHNRQQILSLADAWHASEPDHIGMAWPALCDRLSRDDRRFYARAALGALQSEGLLVQRGDLVLRPGHVPATTAEDQAFRYRALPMLAELRSRSVHELAAALDMPVVAVKAALHRLALRGEAIAVTPARFIAREQLESLAGAALNLAQANQLRASEFSRTTGIGRNLSVDVLEFFDRIRLTRRVGDRRIVVNAHALAIPVLQSLP